MRKKLAALLLALAGVAGFAAGTLLAPTPAEAACKQICCARSDGSLYCITCCQAPCPTIYCPP
jgi:hypothetical protein